MNAREIRAQEVGRALYALELRKAGMTYKRIGEILGRVDKSGPLSPPRVQQILLCGERVARLREQKNQQ